MGESEQILVAVAAGVVIVWLLGMIAVLKRCLYIVGPHEILVVSGRRSVLPDGRVVGYRIVTEGRGLRVPFIERVDRIDATAMTVPIQIQRAYSRDGTPADISATATVRPCTDGPELINFIERFLGRRREEIERIACETLEGHMRTVAAKLAVAELNLDRDKVAHEVRMESEHDMCTLGLQVDTLVLHEVTPPPPARVPD